jgi:hypothetical protein
MFDRVPLRYLVPNAVAAGSMVLALVCCPDDLDAVAAKVGRPADAGARRPPRGRRHGDLRAHAHARAAIVPFAVALTYPAVGSVVGRLHAPTRAALHTPERSDPR